MQDKAQKKLEETIKKAKKEAGNEIKIRLDGAQGQADQEQVVNDIEARLRGFRGTRVVLPPMLSLVAPAAPSAPTAQFGL